MIDYEDDDAGVDYQHREKVYFKNGERVTLKQDIPNKPIMMVERIDKATMMGNNVTKLLGVTCIWFDKNQIMQRNRFSTKDLVHVND